MIFDKVIQRLWENITPFKFMEQILIYIFIMFLVLLTKFGYIFGFLMVSGFAYFFGLFIYLLENGFDE